MHVLVFRVRAFRHHFEYINIPAARVVFHITSVMRIDTYLRAPEFLIANNIYRAVFAYIYTRARYSGHTPLLHFSGPH